MAGIVAAALEGKPHGQNPALVDVLRGQHPLLDTTLSQIETGADVVFNEEYAKADKDLAAAIFDIVTVAGAEKAAKDPGEDTVELPLESGPVPEAAPASEPVIEDKPKKRRSRKKKQ